MENLQCTNFFKETDKNTEQEIREKYQTSFNVFPELSKDDIFMKLPE